MIAPPARPTLFPYTTLFRSKPNSDDVRDSPALDVARRLQLEGADVVVYDPEAAENAHRVHPDLPLAASLSEALDGSHVTVLLTEWEELQAAQPEALGARSEEHTSELQSRGPLVCRLLLGKKQTSGRH